MSEEQKPPSQILAFDPTKKRGPEPVDLDSPFFTLTRDEHPKCNHRNVGVTLNTSTRKAICKCGTVIDNFDALLIYANAQRRLVSTRKFIEEHNQREAEKKARRPFARERTGFVSKCDAAGRLYGWHVTLECKHEVGYPKRGRKTYPPRRITCHECIRLDKLKQQGVSVLPESAAK